MPYYIPDPVSKTTCIGNTLSTFNTSLVSLDTAVYELSTSMDTVVEDYFSQGILQCPAQGGTISWDVSSVGVNASLALSATVRMNNISGLVAGQEGNLIVTIASTATPTISSFGNAWVFTNTASSISTLSGAKNQISFYYDGTHLLSKITNFLF